MYGRVAVSWCFFFFLLGVWCSVLYWFFFLLIFVFFAFLPVFVGVEGGSYWSARGLLFCCLCFYGLGWF